MEMRLPVLARAVASLAGPIAHMIGNYSKQPITDDRMERFEKERTQTSHGSWKSSLDSHANLTNLLTNIGPQTSLKNGDL